MQMFVSTCKYSLMLCHGSLTSCTYLQLLAAFLRHESKQRLVGMRNGQSTDGCRYASRLWVCARVHDSHPRAVVNVTNGPVMYQDHAEHSFKREHSAICDSGRTNLCVLAHRDEYNFVSGIFCGLLTMPQTQGGPCRLYLCVCVCVLCTRQLVCVLTCAVDKCMQS